MRLFADVMDVEEAGLIDCFVEAGAGEVGGFAIGKFSVKNYENKGTTGEELATQAALRELGLTGMAFCGVV